MRKLQGLILIFLLGNNIIGQDSLQYNYLGSYYTDFKSVITSPARADSKDWLIVGSSVATGIVIYANDVNIRNEFAKLPDQPYQAISTYVAEPFGSGVLSMTGTAIALGIGYLTDDEKLRYVSYQSFKAYLFAGGGAFVVKQLTHRMRPSEWNGEGNAPWLGPYALTGDYDSFPSGHTTAAFAIATVWSEGYKEHPWVSYSMYSLATLTGLSRIYDNKHWASDVFFGALFGYWIGHQIMSGPRKWQIYPSTTGVGFTYQLD